LRQQQLCHKQSCQQWLCQQQLRQQHSVQQKQACVIRCTLPKDVPSHPSSSAAGKKGGYVPSKDAPFPTPPPLSAADKGGLCTLQRSTFPHTLLSTGQG
jgi:hypothetical protein